MFKIKSFLPILLVALLAFTGCIERTWKDTTHNTVPAEYHENEADFKRTITDISPSEEVIISTSVTRSNNSPTIQSLNIELVNPTAFPESGGSFLAASEKIRKEAERSVANIGEYNRLNIHVRQTSMEDGTEKSRSYKKDIQL